jgi:PAP2 superfamily
VKIALAAVSALFLVAPQATAREHGNAAADWIEVELAEIAAHRTNPPRAARALASVSVAMRDGAQAPSGLQRATVAGAASTVLGALFPDRADAFEELAQRESPRSAVEAGRRIGAEVVADAQTDGSDAVWSGTVPVGPGLWVPTPPSPPSTPPLEPLAGTWRTWNLATGSQFRPGPPPAFGTDAYAQQVREVYDVSRALTDEQRQIATFWADGPGTVTPPGHWNQIGLDLILSRELDTADAALVLAALNTAQADAFIACWDAKYTYWTERPVTAIRRELDPNWLPIIGTPPFPSYVSGHSTTSGAASDVLSAFFPEAAAQLRAWAEEAAISRLYAGIHFSNDNNAGLVLGRQVGRVALDVYGTSLDGAAAIGAG